MPTEAARQAAKATELAQRTEALAAGSIAQLLPALADCPPYVRAIVLRAVAQKASRLAEDAEAAAGEAVP